jgi:hypothetical protein
VFLDVLQTAGVHFRATDTHQGFPHRLTLPNGSEILFRETKDPAKLMGPEYGWFYIDEASEENRKLFVDLQGRMRLSQARKYLKGILTTNPPPLTHWIPDIFGTQPGVREVVSKDRKGHKTSTHYKLMRVSTIQNPYVPESYIADLVANNPESEVRRIIYGEYGFVHDGKPVYAPPFDFTKHVDAIAPYRMSLARGWDFGYHCPVVTWHQFPRCRHGKIHWAILHEYIGRDLESEELAMIVMDQTQIRFPKIPRDYILDAGDHAGAQVGEKGPGPIVRLRKKPYDLLFRHRAMPNIDPGIALIRDALRSPRCKCGDPALIVDRSCRHTIDAFAGGYHYPNNKTGREISPKPVKDGFYDNVMDSIRYAGENFYRMLHLDQELQERLQMSYDGSSFAPDPEPWAWMER